MFACQAKEEVSNTSTGFVNKWRGIEKQAKNSHKTNNNCCESVKSRRVIYLHFCRCSVMVNTGVFHTSDEGSIPFTDFAKKFDFFKIFCYNYYRKWNKKCASFNVRTHPLRVVNVRLDSHRTFKMTIKTDGDCKRSQSDTILKAQGGKKIRYNST